MVEAMEAWESVAKLPVRLQMLATLLGVGYQSKEIAEFIGVHESRVCQLRGQLGELLGAMA
jgi:DNA-directed RNA polymerase specialized sigma subunit